MAAARWKRMMKAKMINMAARWSGYFSVLQAASADVGVSRWLTVWNLSFQRLQVAVLLDDCSCVFMPVGGQAGLAG